MEPSMNRVGDVDVGSSNIALAIVWQGRAN
jgi:hypothetical protein